MRYLPWCCLLEVFIAQGCWLAWIRKEEASVLKDRCQTRCWRLRAAGARGPHRFKAALAAFAFFSGLAGGIGSGWPWVFSLGSPWRARLKANAASIQCCHCARASHRRHWLHPESSRPCKRFGRQRAQARHVRPPGHGVLQGRQAYQQFVVLLTPRHILPSTMNTWQPNMVCALPPWRRHPRLARPVPVPHAHR